MVEQQIKKCGFKFKVVRRKDLFWRNVLRNKWENRTFRIFQQFLNSNSVYLDIGAWIGPTVLFGASIASECLAIEPDPIAFAELKTNVELNPKLAKKIILFNGCVGQETGIVRFGSQSIFGDSQSSLLFSDGETSVDVEALSFKDLLARFSIISCDFIKMDIEGGETIVLPTMKSFLSDHLPSLYLSLHQKWFRNKASDCAMILDVLSVYPYIYDSQGALIKKEEFEDYLLKMDVAEVVCLKNSWPFLGNLWHRMLGE